MENCVQERLTDQKQRKTWNYCEIQDCAKLWDHPKFHWRILHLLWFERTFCSANHHISYIAQCIFSISFPTVGLHATK